MGRGGLQKLLMASLYACEKDRRLHREREREERKKREEDGLVARIYRLEVVPPTTHRHVPHPAMATSTNATLNVLTNPFGKYHDHKNEKENGGKGRKEAAHLNGSVRSLICHNSRDLPINHPQIFRKQHFRSSFYSIFICLWIYVYSVCVCIVYLFVINKS